jgi:fructose-specific phosphotransferase system IIC component
MWRETNLLGIYISPLVTYMLAALVVYLCLRPLLVRSRLLHWTANIPLAETSLYACILGALIVFA